MTEQEKHFPQTNTTETAPAANGETGKKPGLMRGARDFIENTWSSLKGKDLNQAVEEFTSEMTLVAEGLSEDQNALRRDGEKLAARMEKLAERQKIGEDSVKALQDQLEQERRRGDALQKRLDDMEKALKAKPVKPGLDRHSAPGYLGRGHYLRRLGDRGDSEADWRLSYAFLQRNGGKVQKAPS